MNMITWIKTKIANWFGFYKTREVSNVNSNTSVVITGVEKSPQWGNCPGSMQDCDTFKEIISQSADSYDLTILKNEQATVLNWKLAVTKAVKKPLAIIYYSGHGGSDVNHVLGTGQNEADGVDEFLCLYDKPLVDDEIWDILSKAVGRVFFICDCCHSETMFRTANGAKHLTDFNFTKFELKSREATSGPSILCWSACADNTVAQGSYAGGIFTNYLKKLFGIGMTYDAIWNRLKSCKELNNIEQIQITEIGKSFQSNLFCR